MGTWRAAAAIAVGGAVALSGAAAAPGNAAATSPLPPGSTIAGVDVSNLGPKRTRAAIEDQLGRSYERRVFVHGRHRKVPLTTKQIGQKIHYGAMVEAAFAQAEAGKPVKVTLDRDLSRARLTRSVSLVGRKINKPPRNATVRLGLFRPSIRKARYGLGVDRGRLRKSLVDEVLRPNEKRRIGVHLVRTRPGVTTSRLRAIHGTYISVDRSGFRLRLFKRLRRAQTYSIAVGRAGFGTPGGLFHIRSKDYNPAWHVPNSSWAGALAGQTIPPSDPRNPLRGVYMGVGAGFGIHGTSEPWSVGSRASHGCIRMREWDARALAARTPVGTPVLIR
jgi:hypothetical protein